MKPLATDRNESEQEILKGDIVNGTIAGDDVRQAIEHEHGLGFIEALKLYSTAVGWSVFFSLGMHTSSFLSSTVLISSVGVIMTAFDPQLLGM
jgi:hypothetical protein